MDMWTSMILAMDSRSSTMRELDKAGSPRFVTQASLSGLLCALVLLNDFFEVQLYLIFSHDETLSMSPFCRDHEQHDEQYDGAALQEADDAVERARAVAQQQTRYAKHEAHDVDEKD